MPKLEGRRALVPGKGPLARYDWPVMPQEAPAYRSDSRMAKTNDKLGAISIASPHSSNPGDVPTDRPSRLYPLPSRFQREALEARAFAHQKSPRDVSGLIIKGAIFVRPSISHKRKDGEIIPSIPQQIVDRCLGPRLRIHALDDHGAGQVRTGPTIG